MATEMKPKQSKAWIWVLLGLFVIVLLLWFFVFKEDDAKPAASGGCKDGEEKVGTKCLVKCEDGKIRVGEVCQVVSTLPSARYVKVERPTGIYPANVINLGEIEVFDKAGTNIALNAAVTGGPTVHPAGPFSRLTDGEKGGYVAGNYAHTAGDGVPFLQVDLGAVKEIAKVVITNRGKYSDSECCSNRLTDAKLILLDAGNTPVITTAVIETTKKTITYDFNVETPAWVYADA